MQNPRRWPSITIYVIIQLAWLALVTVWIIWYSKNLGKNAALGTWDIVVITEVAVLFLLILFGILSLFILFQKQLTLMKTQMHILSSITHEFKTPLATTQLYLETIRKHDLPAETKIELIDGMLLENQRLKNLVEDFLENARASYKQNPYRLKRVQFSKYIEGFRERHAALIKGVDFTTDIPDDVVIAIDQSAFDMALSNLVENAVFYSTGQPHIAMSIWHEKKWIYIRFSDSGIGIPKERRKDVFKMFKRLPEGVALISSGTGMGLYVVKNIINAHGGRIAIGETDEDHGTTFIIRLPAPKS